VSKIELKLQENGTTGYVWDVAHRSENVLVKKNDFVGPEDDLAIGSGGTRTFIVETPQQLSSVTFDLRRPWEPPEEIPARQITLIVE